MHKPGKSKLQIARFLVQLAFLTAVIYGFNTKTVANALAPTILLLGVFFCGWICPLGAAQDWASWLGRKLNLPRLRVPQRAQRYLQISRYAFFMLLIAGIAIDLLKGPYNFSRLLHGELFTLASAIIGLFLLLSLFIDRPFCNYFCTGGAKQGLFSVLRIFGIRKNSTLCVGCGQCSKACPMNIDIANSTFVRHPNCIGCCSCISTCRKKALSYGINSPRNTKK